jgi:hypothetical protein
MGFASKLQTLLVNVRYSSCMHNVEIERQSYLKLDHQRMPSGRLHRIASRCIFDFSSVLS